MVYRARFLTILALSLAACCSAWSLSLMEHPRPQNVSSAELRRFVELRDLGELRIWAVKALHEEAYRVRRVERHKRVQSRDALITAAREVQAHPDDETLVLSVLERELGSEETDWEHIEWALIALHYGRFQAEGLVEIVRQVLVYPRGEKISDSHGNSLLNALVALEKLGTAASKTVLEEARSREFWEQAGPIRSQSLRTDAAESLGLLMRRASSAHDAAMVTDAEREASSPPRMPASLPSNGKGDDWKRLLSARTQCEAKVAETYQALAKKILTEEIDNSIQHEIIRQMEQSRIRAATDASLLFARSRLRHETQAQEPDWAIVDESLRICFYTDALPADLLDDIRRLLSIPRSTDAPNDHRAAILAALAVAGRIGTEEAAELLVEATREAFWEENGPAFPPDEYGTLRHVDPTDIIRVEALRAMSFCPGELAIDRLKAIQTEFQDGRSFYDSLLRFEYRAWGVAQTVLNFIESRESPPDQAS